jgi:hypothetical protein
MSSVPLSRAALLLSAVALVLPAASSPAHAGPADARAHRAQSAPKQGQDTHAPLVAAVRQYFHHLDHHWTKGAHTPPGLPVTPAGRAEFEAKAGVIDEWRTMYGDRDIEAVRYDDDVAIATRPEFGADRRSATASFQVERSKRLDHASYSSARDITSVETYVVTFTRSRTERGLGRWLISSMQAPDVPPDYAGEPLPATGEPSNAEIPDTFTPPGKSGVITERSAPNLRIQHGAEPLQLGLDYQAMADYAKIWSGFDFVWSFWSQAYVREDRHNEDEYPTYDNNCINFVSQALYAGGWEETTTSSDDVENDDHWAGHIDAWTDLYTTTRTWRATSYWQKFATNKGRVSRLDSIWDAALGDVLLADWDPNNTPDGATDHAMIVTGWDSVMGPYISQNSPHRQNIPLSESLERAQEQGKDDIDWYAYRT